MVTILLESNIFRNSNINHFLVRKYLAFINQCCLQNLSIKTAFQENTFHEANNCTFQY